MTFIPSSEITDNEHLMRAVKPWHRFWKKDKGKVSSAAFKEKEGKAFSVDRDGDRQFREILQKFDKKFGAETGIITLLAESCRAIPTHLVPRPSRNNDFHAEIHESPIIVPLSNDSCLQLSIIANTIKSPPQLKK